MTSTAYILWNEAVIVVSCLRQFLVFFSFNNIASILNYRVLNDKMMDDKVLEGSGHDPGHYPTICVEGWINPIKTSVQTQTTYLWNKGLQALLLHQPAQYRYSITHAILVFQEC